MATHVRATTAEAMTRAAMEMAAVAMPPPPRQRKEHVGLV